MHDPTEPLVNLDTAGRIDRDLPCLKCGYNLRGLSPQQICPECGQHVFDSIHGDWLEYSDPEWVGKVASGMRWIIRSLICGFVWGLISGEFTGAGRLLGAPIGLMLIYGFWRFTSPDPKDTHGEPGVSLRKVVRFGSIVGFLVTCGLGAAGVGEITVISSPARPPGPPAATVSVFPGTATFLASWLLILAYGGRLV